MSNFTLRCPACGAGNRPLMTWCIECGEPLDEAAPSLDTRAARRAAGEAARLDRQAAGRGRWERVLGLGLLLAVLLAGVLDWWQQDHGAVAYRRGATAATARHWADAQAAFADAEGYRDAPARAAAAQATLQQIIQLYDEAGAATVRRDWATAARDYSRVAELQPDFREVASLLPPIRTTLLQQQAAGTIVGTAGSAAGLYRLGLPGQAARRLPGSDGASRVRLYAGAGRWVVYDATVWPATGAHGDPTHRVLRLADLSNPAAFQVTTLPDDLPPDGAARPTPAGFWWFSPSLPGAGVVYYDYATGTVRPPALTPGWSLAATDPAHGWLLLSYSEGGADGAARTWLYLCDADGVIFTPVTVVDGLVQDAQVSPDGRAVLFTNVLPQHHRPYTGLDLLLVRLDVPAATLPPATRVLKLDTLKLPEEFVADKIRLTARFLPGPGPIRILTDHTDQYGRRQALYDAGTGMQITIWGDLPPPQTLTTFDLSSAGVLVLTQHLEADATRLVLQSAELAKAGELHVPSTADSLVSARLAAHDTYLLISVNQPHPSRSRQVYTLYSAALTGHPMADQPTPLYTGIYDPALVPTPLLTAAPGGDALLYLTPGGALQVTTLDGRVSGPLATSVRRLWVP